MTWLLSLIALALLDEPPRVPRSKAVGATGASRAAAGLALIGLSIPTASSSAVTGATRVRTTA